MRNRSMAWVQHGYKYHSKYMHFRWKIKWRPEHLDLLWIMGGTAPLMRPKLKKVSVSIYCKVIVSSSESAKDLAAFLTVSCKGMLSLSTKEGLNLKRTPSPRANMTCMHTRTHTTHTHTHTHTHKHTHSYSMLPAVFLLSSQSMKINKSLERTAQFFDQAVPNEGESTNLDKFPNNFEHFYKTLHFVRMLSTAGQLRIHMNLLRNRFLLKPKIFILGANFLTLGPFQSIQQALLGFISKCKPDISQTRTVWSKEAETTRSSLGWNCAHIT